MGRTPDSALVCVTDQGPSRSELHLSLDDEMKCNSLLQAPRPAILMVQDTPLLLQKRDLPSSRGFFMLKVEILFSA